MSANRTLCLNGLPFGQIVSYLQQLIWRSVGQECQGIVNAMGDRNWLESAMKLRGAVAGDKKSKKEL